jgi:hypothetical protein
MKIRNAKTIKEYKEIKNNKINNWINNNFFEGCVTWELCKNNSIKVTDKTGDSMIISLDEIE